MNTTCTNADVRRATARALRLAYDLVERHHDRPAAEVLAEAVDVAEEMRLECVDRPDYLGELAQCVGRRLDDAD